jgi:dynactin 1
MFLPDSFHEDRDSVSALLRFKRVAFKAGMLQTFVKERLAQVDKFDHGNESQLMAACEMCDKLTWVSAMCDRFVTCISSCSVDQFSRFQGALYELDPVERALNGWIEGLRRDELNERNCVSELQRTMALMSHLGEIHLKNDLEGFASDMHMRVLMMQTHMESTAAAVSLIKLAIQKKLPTTTEDEDTASSFAKKSDAIISQSRNIKVVVSKILRSLDDFRLRNLSIATDKKTAFEECEAAAQKLATYMRAVGNDVYNLLFHAADAPEPTWPDLLETMFRTTEKVLSMSESDIFNAISKDLRNLGAALSDLAAVATDIDMTAEFEKAPPPWQVRALDLKSTKVVNVDIEEELRRLKYDIRESATQIRLRDMSLEESAVKIELLESRMRNVTKQSERIEALEKLLLEGGQREKDFSKAIEELNEEVQALETEVGKWRKAAEDKRAVGETDRAGQERAVATAREVESLKKEIMNLKGAVEFFREEAAAIRRRDLTAPDSWLLEPLVETPEMLVRKYEAQLAKEARDVMGELRSLVLEEKVVKITRTKKDMRWRPVKESPKWTCARQKERYEAVKGWKEDLLGRVQAHTGGQEKKRGGEVGKVKLRLPEGWTKLQGEVDQVVVHEPESWEELRGQLGVMDV